MTRVFLPPQTTSSAKLPFRQGDAVEVASTEEGFIGSYYEATVVAELPGDYIVEYTTLVTDDFSGPLREVATAAEVRPRPPEIKAAEYRLNDVVDVFANDGWWEGRITDRMGNTYNVFFDSTGDEIWYPKKVLRFHQEWKDRKWVC